MSRSRAVPWTPSKWFEVWWAKDEACAGLKGNMSKIRWFVVPGHTFDDPSGGVLDGAPDVRWWPGYRRTLRPRTPQPARALL